VTRSARAAPLIIASGISKSYPKVTQSWDRLRSLWHVLSGSTLPAHMQTTVLNHIDLSVQRGESLGVIGENGAGKSTLLKLLTGVINPTSGQVVINGSVGALIELGAGFHPEYSGLENLKLAGALYGFTPSELSAKLDEIIAFADIGDYLFEPVKHYSSGMVVRLGFALLAARKPDLLITDEVLAVGDESFQKKCVRWIEDYLAGGGTLLLVSHSMYHIQKMCRKALWLKKGEPAMMGDVFDVTQAYLAYHERKLADVAKPFTTTSALAYQVRHSTLNGHGQDHAHVVQMGADVVIDVTLFSPDQRAPVVLIGMVRADGTPVYGVTSDFDGITLQAVGADQFRARYTLSAIALLPGQYECRVHAMDPEGVRLFDTQTHQLTVRGDSREFGLVRLTHHWNDRSQP
jgi:lipopolysaccharide transport system ATP-binding protein